MASLNSPVSSAALASATSANGTKRTGATLATNGIRPTTLCMLAYATIVTGSVVATFTWEVSADATNWYTLKDTNDATVTTVTATDTRALNCPHGVMGWQYVRACATLSGAATNAGDLTQIDYHYRPYGQIP